MVEIPARFREYITNGVAADFVRSEGRLEDAQTYEMIAEAAIQQQIDVLIRQQGQIQRVNMLHTY